MLFTFSSLKVNLLTDKLDNVAFGTHVLREGIGASQTDFGKFLVPLSRRSSLTDRSACSFI